MGNKLVSDSSYGKIMIRLNKGKYTAGDQVEGMIYLDLYTPFPTSVLNLLITGREKVRIIESRMVNNPANNRMEEKISIHEDERNFYEHNFPIYTVNAMNFLPGQYTFPFTFKLLENLPGSFHHTYSKGGHSGYGIIEYEIFAGFKSLTSSLAFFDSVNMLVDQRAELTNGPVQTQTDRNFTGYCYKNLGGIGLKCQFDKDRFVVGDNANMNIEIDATNAKTDVTKINVSLVQEITFKTNNSAHNYIYSKTISNFMLGGVKAGSKKVGMDSIPVTMNIRPDREEQATTVGELVKNNYRLSVATELDSCLCCDSPPMAGADVRIFNKALPMPEPFNVPNFQPKIMDPYVCTVSNDYRLSQDMRKDLDLNDETNYPTL